MDDYTDIEKGPPADTFDFDAGGGDFVLEESTLIDFDSFLKSGPLDEIADKILEGTYGDVDFMKKDILDRFLDYIYFKINTGEPFIIHWAYPTKRMMDRELEQKAIELLNVHLYPEIVLRLMKFFSRNIHNSDSNLYIANLVYSKDIFRSVYETFKLFKDDIFISAPNKRSLNVKRIQQFTARSENRLSSSLDADARLNYILDFFMIKYDVSDIYTTDGIRMFS